MIGQELDGRYRILSKLGQGGMGEVYLVEHMLLRRHEALKVLRPSLDQSGDLVSRFRREARATNRLQHPNIVSVYDFGQLPDGRFYLTTEYADGENLSVLLQRRGRLTLRRAMHILDQMCGAVDHAHARGVVHRDLKPANMILVERRGHPDILKVFDFGVAKIIDPNYQDSVAATRQGALFGTPAYLAPEQVRGGTADPRIDIYAMGCIAYELVVGSPPFTGKAMQVVGAHLKDTPPRLRASVPKCPEQLDAIVAKCLDKSPDRRFQTAAEMLVALQQVPGYDRDVSTGKRAFVAVAEEALLDVRASMSVDNVATAETMHSTQTVGLPPSLPEATWHYQSALRQAAETLVDQGTHDFRLTIDVANIAAFEGRLGRIVNEVDELERHGDALEQRRREHEASLRFAIGELRFECDQERAAERPVDPDVVHQLTELERSLANLANEINAELEKVDRRIAALSAERESMQREQDERYANLATRVEASLAEEANTELLPLRERIESAAEAVEVAKRERRGDG